MILYHYKIIWKNWSSYRAPTGTLDLFNRLQVVRRPHPFASKTLTLKKGAIRLERNMRNHGKRGKEH